jgi:hypothetical protein
MESLPVGKAPKEQHVIGIRLLRISAVYMVIGLVMGLSMGIASNFTLSSVHAHISLLGWLTMAVTGIVYLVIPGCARGRLAVLHFWGHNLGLPVMMSSLVWQYYGKTNVEAIMAISSLMVLLSLVLFAVNLFVNGRPKDVTDSTI